LWRIICETHRFYSISAGSLTIHKPWSDTAIPLASIRGARLEAPWYSSFFAKPLPTTLVLLLDDSSELRLYPTDCTALLKALNKIDEGQHETASPEQGSFGVAGRFAS
jgi:hypothetical protein